MLFDIEHNTFWDPEWGSKPNSKEEAKAIAKKAIEQAPNLIPVFSHRYLPSEPYERGNPVLSVYQTDIVVYGVDLPTYLANEFHWPLAEQAKPTKDIRSWTRWMLLGSGR